MLRPLRQTIINQLWETYRSVTPQMHVIEQGLQVKGQHTLTLDHFAVIDLPGAHSGIPILSQLFTLLGYTPRGKDYLPEKQNDFLWLCESDCGTQPIADVLPQIVVADFRPQEMPEKIRHIIQHYAAQTKPLPILHLQQLIERVKQGCEEATRETKEIVLTYLTGRDWPLPTVDEFHCVHTFNELLAWVLVFGRRPNHFTLSIHLMDKFNSLESFHHFVNHELTLPLNQDGGVIKGCQSVGIEQGSTVGIAQTIALADGTVELPVGFVEFVWRFTANESGKTPQIWDDYFTGFVANHANHVIESLYV